MISTRLSWHFQWELLEFCSYDFSSTVILSLFFWGKNLSMSLSVRTLTQLWEYNGKKYKYITTGWYNRYHSGWPPSIHQQPSFTLPTSYFKVKKEQLLMFPAYLAFNPVLACKVRDLLLGCSGNKTKQNASSLTMGKRHDRKAISSLVLMWMYEDKMLGHVSAMRQQV